MQGISATEADEMLKGEHAANTVLLDVREDVELSLAAVDGAMHIPMGQIPARIGELNPNQTIVVMCHTGGRSAQVAHYLTQQGFANVFNLDGGIQAWSRTVDQTVPEY